MLNQDITKENWKVVLSALPSNWKELGEKIEALNYMRGFSSPEALLQTLLLHIAKGYSLRETSVKADLANLASVSDVALLKRLKKSEKWLKELCFALMQENGVDLSQSFFNVNLRVVDGTSVKEPGKTGSEWRFIYSLRIPSLECDFFDLAPAHIKGGGESFKRLQVKSKDYIMGDRGYASTEGVEHIYKNNGFVLVRTNGIQLPLYTTKGKSFDKLHALSSLENAGQIKSWDVAVKAKDGTFIKGRLCAVRKSVEEIIKAHERLIRRGKKKSQVVKAETFEFAKFVVVFTTFPASPFEAPIILEIYRLRWQIELAFKRLKTLVRLGHLPKSDEASSRAWLYGKLFVGLLVEKLTRLGRDFSPWGYDLRKIYAQQMA